MTEGFDLNSYVPVSKLLQAVLDISSRLGQSKQFTVIDAMAEQLGIDSDRLDEYSYWVLADMVPELESVLNEDPGNWVNIVDQGRHVRIAEAAVNKLNLLELPHVLEKFGLARFKPPLTISHTHELEPKMKAHIVSWLAPRVLKMLDQWRNRGAWDPDLARGIVPMPKGPRARQSA